ncbi:geranylgeranyl diphosphate synthase type II [Mobilisporobacter senegalensis]|uniref:Farnesyl diphosphate synthase n=1 Tax=Mobilisporobacter senegalensis TaxID=1329262 RepID=A0A3N1XK62_9FIRM|nr:farnesyl diphosphate synthase [Mobilisporobacter senegalensis]ROR27125.1 geranylgeranyl diphosphate synthase type II [Mobilisporobacter senegalensis]
MNFEKEQNDRIEYIEQILKEYLPEEAGLQKYVIEAMNYSVLGGGKRIRPLLMLETFCLFQKKISKVIEPFMAAIEMIHTYSLVHDDLPAMDNDEYRRGRKTTHVVYGEAMGILAGDGLLNYAYEVACKAFDMGENPVMIADAVKVLARKPGIYGMIGGQVVDVLANGSPLDKERLDFIYKLKTSALIECSMLIGAILGGATKEELEIIEQIASDVGLAFQIQDDILDVTSTLEVLGKPIGSDEKNSKTTYVTLEGLEKSKEDVQMISDRALKNLNMLKLNYKENLFLEELIRRLVSREK